MSEKDTYTGGSERRYPWVCGSCDHHFTKRKDWRETTCPRCGQYMCSMTGKQKVPLSELPDEFGALSTTDSDQS